MKTHQDVDRRSLVMALAIAQRIDEDPERGGLARARATCARWMARRPAPAYAEWEKILEGSWPEVRTLLVDDSERGRRLRQSNPFAGVLSNRERWAIYNRFRDHDAG